MQDNLGVGKMEREPEVESPNHAFKRRVHEAAGTINQNPIVTTSLTAASSWPVMEKIAPVQPSSVFNNSGSIISNKLDSITTSDRKYLTKSEEARRKMMFRTKPLSNMDSRGIVAACKREYWRNDGISHMFHAVQETSRVRIFFLNQYSPLNILDDEIS